MKTQIRDKRRKMGIKTGIYTVPFKSEDRTTILGRAYHLSRTGVSL